MKEAGVESGLRNPTGWEHEADEQGGGLLGGGDENEDDFWASGYNKLQYFLTEG